MYFAVDLLTTVNLDFQSEYILLAMIYDKEVYIICDITVNDKLITKTPFFTFDEELYSATGVNVYMAPFQCVNCFDSSTYPYKSMDLCTGQLTHHL